jgi:spore germination cell wall hydrolase CwlJ-like protein
VTPENYAALPDRDLMALCVWREARGEEILGKRGVAHVILNRVNNPSWWGNSIQSVILKARQFSSFNPGDPNETRWPLDDDPSFMDCQWVCNGVLQATDEDITNGAEFYYDISIPAPSWAADYTFQIQIGRLKFYKL